jgi:hypothetical protein
VPDQKTRRPEGPKTVVTNDGHTHHRPDMHGHAEAEYNPRISRRELTLGESLCSAEANRPDMPLLWYHENGGRRLNSLPTRSLGTTFRRLPRPRLIAVRNPTGASS